MTIVLYDLCAADETRRFSPHCWKTRMALAHKGLAFDTVPVPFTGIRRIGDGFSPTVPVLDDNGTLIRDSFAIALHLEETHPDRPSLFGGPGGQAMARFVESWAQTVLNPSLTRMIVLDIHTALAEPDQHYFRESREQRLGATLEEVDAKRDGEREVFRKALQPLRHMLQRQPFIGGEGPLFCDHIVFGSLQWARVISPYQVLAPDDPVAGWFGRCLDLYDGIGRQMPAAA